MMTWVDLKGIKLNKISQTKEDKYSLYEFTYMWNLKKLSS